MKKIHVVSWFNPTNYEFVAAYSNGAEAARTVKVLQKVTPVSEKTFRSEEVEIVDEAS
jgi:hypothetical protein